MRVTELMLASDGDVITLVATLRGIQLRGRIVYCL